MQRTINFMGYMRFNPRAVYLNALSTSSVNASSDLSTNALYYSLKKFAEADPLTKITMEMVSHTLGSLQVQQFREEFQSIDTSHLGRISRKDFVRTFSSCDVSSPLLCCS